MYTSLFVVANVFFNSVRFEHQTEHQNCENWNKTLMRSLAELNALLYLPISKRLKPGPKGQTWSSFWELL